jgi:hypothetical protein
VKFPLSTSWLCASLLAVAPVAAANTVHVDGGARLELARGGVARYVIVTSRRAAPAESLAASELASYLGRISGARFSVRTVAGSSPAIVLRRSRTADGDLVGDAYAIQVRGDSLLLIGGSDRAVLYAAYDLLERLGCQWLAPGFAFYDGAQEIVPSQRLLAYESDGDVVERPAIATRILDVGQAASYDTTSLRQLVEWLPKLRYNTVRFPADHGGSGRVKWDNWRTAIAPELQRRGLSIEVGGHGYQNFLSAQMDRGVVFIEHPEWFGRDSTCRRSRATNVVFNSANAEATRFLLDNAARYVSKRPEIEVFDFWPPDGARWAECAADSSLGTPQQRQVALANELASRLRDVRSGAHLEIIAYADALLPPRNIGLDRDVIVDFCPIDQSFDAPIDDAKTPNNARYAAALLEWRRAHPGLLGAYTYYRKYAWRSLPVLIPHYMQRDMRWYAQVPVQRISTYGEPADWFTYELNQLAFGKLAWNPETDVDSLVRRYTDARFGRASAVAAEAIATLENEYRLRGSIPFSASDTPEELDAAAASLTTRLASLNAARSDVSGAQAANLERLTRMLGMALRDVRIQAARVRGDSPTAVATQVDELVRFIGAHAKDGVFLSRGYDDDRGRYQRHYTRESVVVVRVGNEKR